MAGSREDFRPDCDDPFEVQKGVPPPKPAMWEELGARCPWEDMEAGDSFRLDVPLLTTSETQKWIEKARKAIFRSWKWYQDNFERGAEMAKAGGVMTRVGEDSRKKRTFIRVWYLDKPRTRRGPMTERQRERQREIERRRRLKKKRGPVG